MKGAGLSLWDRIRSDPEYVRARGAIQARYGLPLPYDIRTEPGQGEAFLEEVHALFRRFQIPEAWQNDFMAEIVGHRPIGETIAEWSIPTFNTWMDSEGVWRWECVITPETDLTNPAVLKLIQDQQKEHAGDPPQPARDAASPRQRDWRPVYEWHRRHPLFSIEEIAEKLAISASLLLRKFAELEDKT